MFRFHGSEIVVVYIPFCYVDFSQGNDFDETVIEVRGKVLSDINLPSAIGQGFLSDYRKMAGRVFYEEVNERSSVI